MNSIENRKFPAYNTSNFKNNLVYFNNIDVRLNAGIEYKITKLAIKYILLN